LYNKMPRRKTKTKKQRGGACGKTKRQGCKCRQRGGADEEENKTGMLRSLYDAGALTTALNLLPSSDEKSRPKFVGEKHAILRLPNGKTGIANWCGPKTQVIKRLKRNDPPRTYVDKICKAHDVRYMASGGDPAKIRQADLYMINKIREAEKKKLDRPVNLKVARWAIQGKNLAEDLGVMKEGSYGITKENYDKLSPSDRALIESTRQSLSQQGFGSRRTRVCRF
jgi:hypothetical protein